MPGVVVPADLDYVRQVALSFDGVVTTTTWGNEAWAVDGKKFAWRRPLSKADIARFGNHPIPLGELVAIAAIDIDDRDAIVAAGKAGFFTIEHFKTHPMYLVQLERVTKRDLRNALYEAWDIKRNH